MYACNFLFLSFYQVFLFVFTGKQDDMGIHRVRFRFTQSFVDVRERERSYKRGSREQGKSLMNLHNNEAGRRVKFALFLACARETSLCNVASTLSARISILCDLTQKVAERRRYETTYIIYIHISFVRPSLTGHHQKVQGDVQMSWCFRKLQSHHLLAAARVLSRNR